MEFIEQLGVKTIAIIVAVLVAIAVAWAAFHFFEKSRAQGAQARVDHAQTAAMTNSAADAVNTAGAAADRETQSEDLTRSNQQEIRNAQGANDPVNPAVRDAGLRSLCRRAAYRGSERCRLLQPRP